MRRKVAVTRSVYDYIEGLVPPAGRFMDEDIAKEGVPNLILGRFSFYIGDVEQEDRDIFELLEIGIRLGKRQNND